MVDDQLDRHMRRMDWICSRLNVDSLGVSSPA